MGIISRIFQKAQKGGNAPQEAPRLEVVLAAPGPAAGLWTIGGGKGGVGKSLIASNMGVLLSKSGHRVLLVDADLGASNLHTFLGMDGGRLSLSSFLNNKVAEIADLVSKTSIPNLDLISGARDSLDIADAGSDKIEKLKAALGTLDYDYILMDVGPGTASNMLDLFLSGDEGILVTTPEPTSIENTYRFIKCLILRRMRNVINSHGDLELKGLLKRIFENPEWSLKVKTVADIIRHLKELDSERGRQLCEEAGRRSPRGRGIAGLSRLLWGGHKGGGLHSLGGLRGGVDKVEAPPGERVPFVQGGRVDRGVPERRHRPARKTRYEGGGMRRWTSAW